MKLTYAPLVLCGDSASNHWRTQARSRAYRSGSIAPQLHFGAHTSSEITAGCPRISTTLLAQRLQGLERAGVIERRPNPGRKGSLYYLTAAGQQLVEVVIELGNWGARWLELAPEDYDPFVVLWAWKMHVLLDRLPRPRIVIGFDLRDRPKQKFWLLLQPPEPELCIKQPGYDEDLVITTDSRTLTLVHLGRLPLAEAEPQGLWHLDDSPALLRGAPTWVGCTAGLQQYARSVIQMPPQAVKIARSRDGPFAIALLLWAT